MKGGAFPSVDNELVVRAGTVQATTGFTVYPFDITIESFTTRPPVSSTTLIQVLVTDKDGDPVPDVEVELSSSYGFVKEEGLITDSAGYVYATLVNPPNPGAAELTARVGYAAIAKQSYQVGIPAGQPHPLDARRALVVGIRPKPAPSLTAATMAPTSTWTTR